MLFMIVVSGCQFGGKQPFAEFYFDTFHELENFIREIPLLEPDLSEAEIKDKYPDFSEANSAHRSYYRHYVYADLIDAHESILDANYKVLVDTNLVSEKDLKGLHTLLFIYKVNHEDLKGIVLTMQPVSETNIDIESYSFFEVESDFQTRVSRNRPAKGYEPKTFIEDLNIDSYIESGKVINCTYEIMYATTSVFSEQNLRISFFYPLNHERTQADIDFETLIVNYVEQHMQVLSLE